MVMKKKAQAAMEFLMTYGWAILVVLVVIGALAYFGVLNPQNLLPEKCTLPMGLYCKDHIIKGTTATIDPNTISFRLENGKGEGIIIRDINVSGDVLTDCDEKLSTSVDCTSQTSGGQCVYNGIDGWHLANGDSGTVTIRCTGTGGIPEFSGKTKGDITLTYCSDTPGGDNPTDRNINCGKFTHTMEGELMANVE